MTHANFCHRTMPNVVRSFSQQAIGMLAALAICVAAMAAGAAATFPSLDGWYDQLTRPAWAPPNWVFGPVWTILYAMMAVSVWLIWRQNKLATVRLPLILFAVQLALNVAWSWLFFGLHSPIVALIEIVVLWAAIAVTLFSFYRRSAVAGFLLVPYLGWVTFAVALNFGFWQLNS